MTDTNLPTSLMPLRALVVDDLPEVSFALAHVLGKSCEGGVRVANSAAEAISMLERAPAEIVISDLHMPSRDGLSLLAEVQQRWPATLRILLTGQSQWESAMSSIPYCHQFLSKPTEFHHLTALINRVKPWMDGRLDPALADCLAGLSVLPSAGGCLGALEQALDKPNAPRSADLAAIIRRDPALSARVLQIANASFFGGGSRVSDVDGAVSLVGAPCLQDLHRRNALAAGWSNKTHAPLDLDRAARHALVVAQTAKATLRDPRAAEAAYTAGLVHSIGWLILASAPGPFVDPASIPLGLPERLAGQLLAFWGLPSQIVNAVAGSYAPPEEETFGPASAVYLARGVASIVETRATGPLCPQRGLADDFILRHGLSDRLASLLEKAANAELAARRTISPLPMQGTV